MGRKYDKGEYVNVHSAGTSGRFIGVGKILKCDSQLFNGKRRYQYCIKNVKNGNNSGWFNEEHLENLKINLAREDDAKMTAFYEALNTADLDVSFDHNERKQTYTLVGADLEKAKTLFNEIVRKGENGNEKKNV